MRKLLTNKKFFWRVEGFELKNCESKNTSSRRRWVPFRLCHDSVRNLIDNLFPDQTWKTELLMEHFDADSETSANLINASDLCWGNFTVESCEERVVYLNNSSPKQLLRISSFSALHVNVFFRLINAFCCRRNRRRAHSNLREYCARLNALTIVSQFSSRRCSCNPNCTISRTICTTLHDKHFN